MRRSKILFSSILATVLGMGVLTAVAYNQTSEKPVAEKVEASTISSGTRMYLRLFNDFWVSNATCKIKYASDKLKDVSKTITITTKGGETLYYVDLDYDTTWFQVLRYEGGYQKNYSNWPDCVCNNFFEVTGWDSGGAMPSGWVISGGNYISICDYHFQTPSNGTVTVSLKDSGDTDKGNATQGNESNYIYSDWKVTLTSAPSSGYGFSHWTESEDSGSTYVAWSGTDIRTNPITLTTLSGDVYHGVCFKQYRTIYYVSGENYTTTNRIYAWTNYATAGGSVDIVEFGTYADCWAITTVGSEIFSDGIVKFRGSDNKIYKISLFSDNFLLRNSDGSVNTGDFIVAEGAAYYWGGKDADAGAAITLILAVETARNAVEAGGGIMDYSICGISKTDAASFVSTYNTGISATARSYVDATKVYTYKGDGTSAETDIYYSAIFAQLAKIASSGNKSPLINLGFLQQIGGGDINLSITIIIISATTLVSIGAYFFLRRKKEK